jgi:pimeloyl-ACP methyl ester carboxylesterase
VALLTAAARPAQVDQLALVSFGIARSPEEEARARQIGAQIGAAAALWAPWLAMSRPWLAISRPWRQLTWTTPPLPALLAASLLHRIPDASTLALGAADLTSMDALTALESAASQGDLLVMQALGRAAMPALVLSGRQDPVFPPSSAAALSAALPNARTAVIDACGHVPMAEQPEACYDALDSFFIR